MGRRAALRRTAGRVPARGSRLGLDVEGLPARVLQRARPRAASCSRATATGTRRRSRATSAGRPTSWTQQANEVLPALFAAVGIVRPWLFGHSDGGTIALLHAARHPAAGVVAVAPHLFVEEVSVKSIELARDAFESSDLRARLARHHADPDSAFRGWNDVWLAPDVPRLERRARDRDDRLPGAGGAGRGRRVRHAGADPRRGASIAENPLARDPGMRTLAASRPARASRSRGRPLHPRNLPFLTTGASMRPTRTALSAAAALLAATTTFAAHAQAQRRRSRSA